ncbi:hypothetical protein N7481_007537 [Penicillium waksmanii]|uniref:uncharacterized protein n=1 Tax=Penicillium waksmanii TaxID=69791 RepID=UPI00254990CF|nr:uncharacterized protein N7481_007537 [Penicillium waksmanii]KAJ5980239.1 hypothetical protein N7481_007537 [Penicillium waksmanii]
MEATMLFNVMGLWTILIASSAAPLWPLFKAWSQKAAIQRIFCASRRKEQRPGAEEVESDFVARPRGAITPTGIGHGNIEA